MRYDSIFERAAAYGLDEPPPQELWDHEDELERFFDQNKQKGSQGATLEVDV